MTGKPMDVQGLTHEQIVQSRNEFGINRLVYKKENGFVKAIRSLASEPMVLLLLITSLIYFLTGNWGDGLFLAAAIVLVATISLYQDSRSRNALKKLKQFTQPQSKVIRDGQTLEINSEDIVVGDFMVVEEGTTIPADGRIVQSNDFTLNESILTGESFSVFKDSDTVDHEVYFGTMVVSGLAIARVTAIGNQTKLGKIGKSLESIGQEKTPLQIQINNFVQKMVIAGVIVFIIVWIINYLLSDNVLDSLLKALTLAMSILPEEIPVAFTTFMALGAWRLMKAGVVVKQMNIVEALGSATVICVDKTGTITENIMHLEKIYSIHSKRIIDISASLDPHEMDLIRTAMWASEPIPFDPMEVSLHDYYGKLFGDDERSHYKMVHEYPLSGNPPMMTHLFEDEKGDRIIAAKGAPEALIAVSSLLDEDIAAINLVIQQLARQGYRLLGVGQATFKGTSFLERQQDYQFEFKGLVAFHDPPKDNIKSVLAKFYQAGLDVKIITGDNDITALAIAEQIGFKNQHESMSGDDLVKVPDAQLKTLVKNTSIFTRMFPEAKLKIINALKTNGEIVAMTGDGVNDGPALKAAHIGIAMGNKGTEIAKHSAALILAEDDLSSMVDAIAMGRKIYANLKKAIQYIISIHIPIILTVLLPLAFGWIYPNIFTPVHIILLELIMGPTCSIVYENEPIEENAMREKPRPFSATFFSWRELITSIVQGLMITLGAMVVYQYAVHQSFGESVTRTMVFTVLMTANIFLTFVNRSFYYSVVSTLAYKNKLIPVIIGITVLIIAILLFVDPFTRFFQFAQLNFNQILISAVVGFLCVIWFELVKWWKRMNEVNKVKSYRTRDS